MGFERPTTWVVIAVVALILFGYNKLPDAARSVGRSLRIFKSEMKGLSEDDKAREQAAATTAETTSPAPQTGPTAPAPEAAAEAVSDAGPETVNVPPAASQDGQAAAD